MDDRIKKKKMISLWLRAGDRALAEAMADRRSLSLSETVRQAIVNEARRAGFSYVDGLVIEKGKFPGK